VAFAGKQTTDKAAHVQEVVRLIWLLPGKDAFTLVTDMAAVAQFPEQVDACGYQMNDSVVCDLCWIGSM